MNPLSFAIFCLKGGGIPAPKKLIPIVAAGCDAFGFQKRQWGDSPGKLQKFQVSPPQKFDQRFGGYCLPHGLPKQLRPLPWWERLSSLETAETLYV
jgi:hypothetical protein